MNKRPLLIDDFQFQVCLRPFCTRGKCTKTHEGMGILVSSFYLVFLLFAWFNFHWISEWLGHFCSKIIFFILDPKSRHISVLAKSYTYRYWWNHIPELMKSYTKEMSWPFPNTSIQFCHNSIWFRQYRYTILPILVYDSANTGIESPIPVYKFVNFVIRFRQFQYTNSSIPAKVLFQRFGRDSGQNRRL